MAHFGPSQKSNDGIAAIAFCDYDLEMELRHLKTFQTVAEELHFSRAAKILRVAQPALSRTIANLEFEMGVQLLSRNSRGVILTEAGKVFLKRVRRILNATKEAVTEAQARARGETGTLRIGFIGTLSHGLLPKLLQIYRAEFPAVDLILRELGPTDQRQEILAGNLDCGFIGLGSSQRDPEFETVLAAEKSLMVALPALHHLAKRKSLQLVDLEQENFYFTAKTNAPVFNPWLVGLCRDVGFEPKIALESDRSATVLNYVAAGFGVAIFPSQIAEIPISGVRFITLTGRLPKYQYHLAWARGNNTPALIEFARLTHENLKKLNDVARVKSGSSTFELNRKIESEVDAN